MVEVHFLKRQLLPKIEVTRVITFSDPEVATKETKNNTKKREQKGKRKEKKTEWNYDYYTE